MKRLGIFVFYDKQGIVDRYVEYLLEGLREHLSRFVIVCNGIVTDEGMDKLRNFSDEIYVRENTGFDAMAYKLAMTTYLGWDEVEKYDEVLLFNDTFYGPIYPFSEVFDQMAKENCDFWGITYHECFKDYMFGTDTITPAHVHTYFCVYRKSAVMNEAFRNYWDTFDSTEWFFSDVCRHEQTFTQVLEQGGLTWSTYVKTSVYNDADMVDANVNAYYVMAYDIIKYHRCPTLKRKNFIIKNLSWRTGAGGEDVAKAFQFVKDQTDYNVDYIWENILRLYNLYEIKNALHLDYVLPWREAEWSSMIDRYEKTAVIMYVPQEDALWDSDEYVNDMPKGIFLQKVSSEVEWKSCITQLDDRYEYVCMIALHELIPEEPLTVLKSVNYNILENTIKSASFIDRVLRLFEENSRLGLLTVPLSVHANYMGQMSDLWGDTFEPVVAFAKQLELHANITPDIPCLTREIAFWCRTDALRPLLQQSLGDYSLNIIARICPYVAQSQGYYTGAVMNTDYASLQMTNLFYELMGTIKKCSEGKQFTDYDSLFESDIASAVAGYETVMIYGAGSNGIKASNLFKSKGIEVQGFMISDDQPRQTEKNGLPIYRLSEVPFEKNRTMVVVSVAYARDRNVIVQNLKDKGYEHYYLL